MPIADLAANLPWQNLAGQANALTALGSNPQNAMAALGPAYAGSYNAALGLNAALYGGVQTGFQNLRQQAATDYGGIQQGYQNLYGDVMGRLAGSNQTNITDINAQYDALNGQAQQDLISRGLGNSTLQTNATRAVALDRARAITASQNQFAQLGAGYASQLGQAGLQARQQGAQLGASLGQQQLGALERVNVPYPNMGQYAQIAQQFGANALAQQQMALLKSQLHPGGFASGGAGVSGGSHGFAPMHPGGAFDYGSSYGAGPSATVGGYGNPFGVSSGTPQGESPFETAANAGFSSGNFYGRPQVTVGDFPAAEGSNYDNTAGEDLSWIGSLAI